MPDFSELRFRASLVVLMNIAGGLWTCGWALIGCW